MKLNAFHGKRRMTNLSWSKLRLKNHVLTAILLFFFIQLSAESRAQNITITEKMHVSERP
ncbi:hypothetical protein COR50_00010 [Chitinophaga caeni]|uniref:Uncharacterized protein n=1 Tax=Chitinophaga caeni TaxID=2029983 RepID=A0A291QP55_9BACT|nr:hypothetical protein [Chitinophaga caeni]ATL45673.1 hypothetical protein COR50_00010 [Chitinophaga caeni]